MAVKKRFYSGELTPQETQREIDNRALSRMAAGEGAVLLKNEGLLPIAAGCKVAIYGNGIARIQKGGTGSGDVNVRHVVSLLEGLDAAGYKVVNEAAARQYIADTKASDEIRKQKVWAVMDERQGSIDADLLNAIAQTQGPEVSAVPVVKEELIQADAAIFMISRVAGEAMDRQMADGDYYLTKEEQATIDAIAACTDKIILLLNVPAQIDLAPLYARDEIKAILHISQPGMEAGHVIADLLSGRVNPSGRLTATWTKNYEDFPNANTFSYLSGDVHNEYYTEDIYVGYRYFETFGVKPLFPFGFGLSYTTFDLADGEISVADDQVKVKITVKNTGELAGKEVVQIYAGLSQTDCVREAIRLAGFAKTKLLTPGESEVLTITVDAKCFASYDEKTAAWIIPEGHTYILAGKHAEDAALVGVLDVREKIVLETLTHIMPVDEAFETVTQDGDDIKKVAEWLDLLEAEAKERGMAAVAYAPARITMPKAEDHVSELAKEIASKMSDEELTAMLMGEITKGQDNIIDNELVQTGIYVPGAAGETSCRFEEKYGIPAISMADGPAGLRLLTHYDVDQKTGLIYGQGILDALEGGVLARERQREDVTTYYMYATAIPIGTMLAQTWNTELLTKIGEMIGAEMKHFGVTWWLAPGINIQRNPLCGRNFEYYSEDPLLAGMMAAAITKGVQSYPGIGTTIKHFACNNVEENRMHSNSHVSERALREIYLRNFEIAVKTSEPMCIMSSYNLINGVPAANNRDLFTTVARGEWQFKGIVMSDWIATIAGCDEAYKCALAGNDLIMPGHPDDVANVMAALKSGALPREAARACVARLITTLMKCQ